LLVVSGVVVDASGAPVPNAVVSLKFVEGSEFLATTNEAGKFVFDAVPPGQAALTANAPGFLQGAWHVEIGDNLSDLGRRVLEPIEEEPPGSQIRGMVQSFKGDKIPASVVVEPLGIELRCTEDGMFQVDVPPGTYELSVSAPGYATQKRKVVVEENGVSILNIDLRRRK
jgi:hypothetical protein